MLAKLITTSLHHRVAAICSLFVLCIFGYYAVKNLNIDAFPDTTPIQIQINTVAPSLVPEEIERLITFPVELSLGGMPKLSQLRSISQFGLSQVVVTFDDGIDIYFARQLINERLQSVEIPPGIPRPEMGPVSTGLGEVFHYIIKPQKTPGLDENAALIQARTIQDWSIKPELMKVPGTAEINSWGGLKKQYQVLINPDSIVKHHLTFQQVIDAIKANNLNVGGGAITRGDEMLLVQGVGRTVTIEEMGNIVISAENGVPIHLKDVAHVAIGHEIRRGAITANGQGEVVLGLGFMRMYENSYNVTHAMANSLEETVKTLPPGTVVETVYDRTELVDQVIATVRKNLGEGALLVVAVLFIFLGNLRAGLIVASAIPFSLIFAFIGMSYAGIAGSLLSLGALDFGLVVDGSVVMIENVVRKLSHGDSKLSRFEVIRQACIEVSKPSMFGVFIIMIVYLPILTLEGVEGKMFRPMALTVIFALAGSLILSMTVIPVFASFFLPKKMEEKDPLFVQMISMFYAPILRFSLRQPVVVLGATCFMLVVAVSMATQLGAEFVPRLSEGAIVIGLNRPPGTSLEKSVEINTRMEQALLTNFPDEINQVWTRQGAPEVATDPGTLETADIFVSLTERSHWKKAKSQEELVKLMNEEMEQFPGQVIWFTQPIEMRINEMLSGTRADVALKLFGPDLDVLIAKGKEIEQILSTIPGCADLNVEQIKGQPIVRFKIDQGQIARHGISAESVLDVVEAIGGKVVGEIIEDQLRFPLVVRLPENLRDNLESLSNLTLPSASGEMIPLSRVVEIQEYPGSRCITREWNSRRIAIQCNIRGRDMGSFVHEAQEKIAAQLQLPPGPYRIVWGGQFENLQRASNRLKIVVPMAMLLIIILLYLSFQNLFDSLVVFTSVPCACTGGILMLFCRDMPFSISAAVGFIALSGISVLNSLVLVEFIRILREQGAPLYDSILQAGLTRLRPVLMTASVASLGFVPMALSSGMGAEVQRPLASVVIGGVISSTLMTLVVLPALYLLGSRLRRNDPHAEHSLKSHTAAPPLEPHVPELVAH
jgi:cobalt-zinc-cadmium resistance protein CzcA